MRYLWWTVFYVFFGISVCSQQKFDSILPSNLNAPLNLNAPARVQNVLCPQVLAFEAMRSDRRVAMDIAALNAGVDAYAHCGRMPEAEACLHETTQRCQQRGTPLALHGRPPRLTCCPLAGAAAAVALSCT